MTKTIVLALTVAAFATAAPCGDLGSFLPKGSTVTTAEAVENGELTIAGKTVKGLPAFCRVSGSLHPTPDSDIRFEVWLPASGWNGKFHGVGNGGFAGTINYAGLIDAVKNKYATASTDTGHADAVNTNASWALNHPEKIIDFGYRGIHETTLAAKATIKGFYGEAPKKSYFNSCSNGGRQALMEAQRYPADYDGIIAGAPAYAWTNLLSSGGLSLRLTLAEAGAYFGPKKLPAIQAAALEQCDAADGVKDGVIENPMACQFHPAVLLCKGEETDACLTPAQLKAVASNYEPLHDAKGNVTFPGMAPGGEADPGAWANWITGTEPEKGSARFGFVTNFFKYIVYSDPQWSYKTFDLNRDLAAANQKAGAALNAASPDLSAFQKRGGKLLMYHGWSDAAIPGASSVKYYDEVVAKLGASTASSFTRLYMVPGMGHCAGGSGTSSFGQGGTPAGDRFTNIDAALEAWVEQSLAPDSIIAAKPKSPANPSAGVARTHPLCPWPQIAKYKGAGNPDEASSYSCSKP